MEKIVIIMNALGFFNPNSVSEFILKFLNKDSTWCPQNILVDVCTAAIYHPHYWTYACWIMSIVYPLFMVLNGNGHRTSNQQLLSVFLNLTQNLAGSLFKASLLTVNALPLAYIKVITDSIKTYTFGGYLVTYAETIWENYFTPKITKWWTQMVERMLFTDQPPNECANGDTSVLLAQYAFICCLFLMLALVFATRSLYTQNKKAHGNTQRNKDEEIAELKAMIEKYEKQVEANKLEFSEQEKKKKTVSEENSWLRSAIPMKQFQCRANKAS